MSRWDALSPRRKDGLALGALALAAALYFAPLWAQGALPHRRDHGELNLPLFHYLHSRYQAGLDAQWMPSVACGEPVLDELISAQAYPPLRLLLSCFDPGSAYLLHFALCMLLAAWGAYALARRHGAGPLGAFLAAEVVGFGGGMAFALPWFTVMVSLAWAPWALLGLSLCQDPARPRRLAGAAVLGTAFGLGFSGGYPGMMAYLCLPLAALQWQWQRGAPGPLRREAWKSLGLAALLALGLAAQPLCSLARLAGQSSRGEALDLAAAAQNSMSPTALLLAAAPHALGRSADDSYLGVSWHWGSYDPNGLVLYLGLASIGLLVIGAGGAWRQRGPVLAAAALLAVYALGNFSPVYGWLIQLPVLSHLRGPVKAILLLPALLAVPLAQGWDLRRGPAGRRGPALLAGLGLGLLLAGALLWALDGPLVQAGEARIHSKILADPLHQRGAAYYQAKLLRWMLGARLHLLTQGLLALAAAGLLALSARRRWAGPALAFVLFADLCANGLAGLSWTQRDYYGPAPQPLAWLQQRQRMDAEPWRVAFWGRAEQVLKAFPQGQADGDRAGEAVERQLPAGNLASVFGLEQFQGDSPAVLRRAELLYHWAQDGRADADLSAQTRELLRRRRLLDLGGVRYIVSSRPLSAPDLELARPARGTEPALYRNRRALPLAYLAEHCAPVASPEAALEALCAPEDPRSAWARPAWVEGELGTDCASGPVQWLERSEARWAVEAEPQGRGGVLVFAQTWYPGLWEARIDGAPAPLWPANVGFCAVPVPSGRHQVELRFRAPEAPWTSAAFVLSLLAALLLLLPAFRSRPRDHA